MTTFDDQASLHQMRRNLPQATFFTTRWSGNIPQELLIPAPTWSDDDLLAGFWREQRRLLTQGQVIWSALIQANYQLFTPGILVVPGEVVTSFDGSVRSDPLLRTAQRIHALKGTQPTDPNLRLVADRITDEYYRSLGERIPLQLTEGWEMYRFTVMFYPAHFPHQFISDRLLPLLAIKGCAHAMMLPHRFWSRELLDRWQPTPNQLTQFQVRQNQRRQHLVVEITPAARAAILEVIAQNQSSPQQLFLHIESNARGMALNLGPNDGVTAQQYEINGLYVLVYPEVIRLFDACQIDYDAEKQGFIIRDEIT